MARRGRPPVRAAARPPVDATMGRAVDLSLDQSFHTLRPGRESRRVGCATRRRPHVMRVLRLLLISVISCSGGAALGQTSSMPRSPADSGVSGSSAATSATQSSGSLTTRGPMGSGASGSAATSVTPSAPAIAAPMIGLPVGGGMPSPSSTCVTSSGQCHISGTHPAGTPCHCYLPGGVVVNGVIR